MATILIPWSGGVDSTYLINLRLNQGHSVIAHWYELSGNAGQVQMETEARRRLTATIKELHRGIGSRFIVENDPVIEMAMRAVLDLSQPPLWVYGLVHSIKKIYQQVDCIEMAYVCNDDAISWLSEIQKLYRAYQPFLEKELPPLRFPMIKMKKCNIYHELHPLLRKQVVMCENPDMLTDDEKALNPDTIWKHCNQCHSCKTFLSSMHAVNIDNYTGRLRLHKKEIYGLQDELPVSEVRSESGCLSGGADGREFDGDDVRGDHTKAERV